MKDKKTQTQFDLVVLTDRENEERKGTKKKRYTRAKGTQLY